MKLLRILSVSLALLFVASCTKEDLDSVLNNQDGALTNEEIISGLKQALSVGTDTSVSILNKTDGYYNDLAVKILLPAEAQVIYSKIKDIPGGPELMEKTIVAMNRAAEDAASEAKPIFINAITSMTINDGLGILKGDDTAATFYLKGKTFDPLFTAFQPKINTSLSKPLVFGLSAEESYSDLIDLYNQGSLGGILYAKITTNSLSEHVTRKGLNGLFLKVAEEEKSIRKDPLARVTDLLKKVFGS